MRQVKTLKKAYALAEAGKLFFIENCGYRAANIGMVVSMFDTMKFYYRA